MTAALLDDAADTAPGWGAAAAALPPAPAAPPARPAATVLVVDDEPHVIGALRRSLRTRGWTVVSAPDGAAGLAVLRAQAVDAVVSDMRMPGMSGAQFLREARLLQPGAVRLLLTGHADVGSALQAVNEGEVLRYFTKPWDDEALLEAIATGLERERLRAERDRLLALTQAQNQALADLNHTLEERVAQRSAALALALADSQAARTQLAEGLDATMRMLSTLVGARAGLSRSRARAVAAHVERVGPRLGLTPAEVQEAMQAALLVDLGQLLLPERLVNQPSGTLQGAERQQWLAHPQNAQALLIGIPALAGPATLLAQLHERHDGSGLPQGLAGEAIPMAARLLAAAADYEAMRCGAMVRGELSQAEALELMRADAGHRYDPQVVLLFAESLVAPTPAPRRTRQLALDQLQPGMELADDLQVREGFVLLPAGRVLDAVLVAKLLSFALRNELKLQACVLDPAPPEPARAGGASGFAPL